MMISLTQIASRSATKSKFTTTQLQVYPILTKDGMMFILCLSYFTTTVASTLPKIYGDGPAYTYIERSVHTSRH